MSTVSLHKDWVICDCRFKAEKLLSAQSSHTVLDTEVTHAHTHIQLTSTNADTDFSWKKQGQLVPVTSMLNVSHTVFCFEFLIRRSPSHFFFSQSLWKLIWFWYSQCCFSNYRSFLHIHKLQFLLQSFFPRLIYNERLRNGFCASFHKLTILLNLIGAHINSNALILEDPQRGCQLSKVLVKHQKAKTHPTPKKEEATEQHINEKYSFISDIGTRTICDHQACVECKSNNLCSFSWFHMLNFASFTLWWLQIELSKCNFCCD